MACALQLASLIMTTTTTTTTTTTNPTTKKSMYLFAAGLCILGWMVSTGCSQPTPSSAPERGNNEGEPKPAKTKAASTTTPAQEQPPAPTPPSPSPPQPTATPDAGTPTSPSTCPACPVGSVCLSTGQCVPLAGDNTCPGGCPSGSICSTGKCFPTGGTTPLPGTESSQCFDRCVARTDFRASAYLQCTEMNCSGFGACDDACFDQHCGGGHEQVCENALTFCQQQCNASSSPEPPPFCVWSFCF